MPEYVLLIAYGKLNKRLTVDSNISVTDLNSRAAENFGLDPGTVALEYYDKGFEEWVVVDDDYKLQDRAKLTLVMVDDKQEDSGGDKGSKDTSNEGSAVGTHGDTQSTRQSVTDAKVDRYKQKISDLTQAKPHAQGIAFIIGMSDAKGAYEDLNSMKKAFDSLNFAVLSEFSLHADEIKALCQAIAKHEFPKVVYYKYIAFYYAGHGGINSVGDSFIQPVQDSQEVERAYIERDVIRVIENQTKKCLLFFFDCCMSNAEDDKNPPKVEVKSTHTNTIIACASSFGEKAAGDTKHGGYWTRTLAKHLDRNERLTVILEDTTAELKKYKQNCPFTINLAKPVNLKASIKPDEESLYKKSPGHEDVVKLLENYTHQYEEIGRLLGLSYHVRQAIRQNYKLENDQKLNEVVNTWITKETSDVTWEHLIEAMKSGKLMKLAGEIEGFIKSDHVQAKYANDEEWKRTKPLTK